MIRHSGIKDSDARLQIVSSSRKITVPPSCRAIGTVGDINSEQVTFECPKLIEGHDIKGCAEHYVTWKNANGEMGHDHLEFIGEDDDFLYYAWIVRGETTTTAGVVSFSIYFEDYSENGKPTYRWGTAECNECEILNCVNAVIGAYQSVYVDEGTLIFADYTPVYDKTVLLQTPGITPSGRKFIVNNGTHDVTGYASVNVSVPGDRPPTIEVQGGGLVVATDGTPQNVTTLQLDAPTVGVNENGTITADSYGVVATHKLSSKDDPHLLARNIKEGVTIFGVTGYLPTTTNNMSVTINVDGSNRSGSVGVLYQEIIESGYVMSNKQVYIGGNDTETINPIGGTFLLFRVQGLTLGITIEGQSATVVYSATNGNYNEYVIQLPYNKEEATVNVVLQ